jgi:hypothetical protein
MEESFKATINLVVKESNKKQIRHIMKQLITIEAIDEETGEAIIIGTLCLK